MIFFEGSDGGGRLEMTKADWIACQPRLAEKGFRFHKREDLMRMRKWTALEMQEEPQEKRDRLVLHMPVRVTLTSIHYAAWKSLRSQNSIQPSNTALKGMLPLCSKLSNVPKRLATNSKSSLWCSVSTQVTGARTPETLQSVSQVISAAHKYLADRLVGTLDSIEHTNQEFKITVLAQENGGRYWSEHSCSSFACLVRQISSVLAVSV